MKSLVFILSFALLAPIGVMAQSAAVATVQDAPSAPAETKQFDFLLGQWQLEVHPKVSSLIAMIHGTPKLVGTWKAWRAADGLGIEDEMRIVDASGNPLALNRARRVWSTNEARWKVSAVDAYHARNSESIGSLLGGVMRLEGHFTESDGKTTLTRTRYYDIGADSFRMQQDRSDDDGKNWEEAVLTIEAKRTAASAAP
jgi:hypothetical protein